MFVERGPHGALDLVGNLDESMEAPHWMAVIALLLQDFEKHLQSCDLSAILSDHHAVQLLQQSFGSDELGDVEALVVLPFVLTYTLTVIVMAQYKQVNLLTELITRILLELLV